MRPFRNRRHAGHLLARKLGVYKNKHPLVLGIPRGAVPMAKVIADALGGDLDVVLFISLVTQSKSSSRSAPLMIAVTRS
jgi:predicted phosphoribosyltransferase